jgi:hypothetical protein
MSIFKQLFTFFNVLCSIWHKIHNLILNQNYKFAKEMWRFT